MNAFRAAAVLMLFLAGCAARPGALPARYYRLMEAGLPAVETRLAAAPDTDLRTPETHSVSTELAHPILAAAVLYTSPHPANVLRGDPRWLALALRLGDLLAAESQKGSGATRLDHRELYLWIETYRIFEEHLGDERRVQWRTEIERNTPDEIGGVIRHHGWSLRVDPSARLLWPVYPFNPYADAPETRLEFAVGVLGVPLRPQSASGRLRTQNIRFVLEAAR